jgi:ferritin-like metal-binding protein YciE
LKAILLILSLTSGQVTQVPQPSLDMCEANRSLIAQDAKIADMLNGLNPADPGYLVAAAVVQIEYAKYQALGKVARIVCIEVSE